jgi:3',5'-cyclic AMP phosphodiesterase CpdA
MHFRTDDDTSGTDRPNSGNRRGGDRRTGPSRYPDDATLATLARLDRPIAAERTRIAVVADPHVSPDARGTSKLYHRSEDRLCAAFADAQSRDVDAVVSVGDLTKDGAPREYELFDECLADLGVPFLAVPGNHDVPKASTDVYEHGDDHETPPVDRFVERYTPGDLPFHAGIGDLDLIGLNTANTPDGELRTSHDGKLSTDQLDWLDEALADLEDAVVLMHHNTPPMYDQLRSYAEAVHPEMEMPPTTRDAGPVVDAFERHDVPLVVTGHLHVPGVADLGTTREVTVPATCSYPQGYVLLDVGPDGTTARYVPVSGLAGMTEAHGERRTGGQTAEGLAAFSAVQLASTPLLDDR